MEKLKKMFWYSCFLCKINVCLKRSIKWTKSYKQKAFSWFCISEKSKFPGKYQEQPYVQPAIFGGGHFLFVPRASAPALIDEVNALPLLIQMGLHIGHKPVYKYI